MLDAAFADLVLFAPLPFFFPNLIQPLDVTLCVCVCLIITIVHTFFLIAQHHLFRASPLASCRFFAFYVCVPFSINFSLLIMIIRTETFWELISLARQQVRSILRRREHLPPNDNILWSHNFLGALLTTSSLPRCCRRRRPCRTSARQCST